jgi:hypothetical protein
MHRPIIVPLAAGALLSMGCGAPKPESRTSNPPEPLHEPVPPEAVQPPGPPPWRDLREEAEQPSTNPPIPRLVVEPDGTCHKYLEDARGTMELRHVHAVDLPTGVAYVGTECAPQGEDECGAVHQCPPEAEKVLAEWKAKPAP